MSFVVALQQGVLLYYPALFPVMPQPGHSILIKGIRDGILISLNEAPFNEAAEALASELERKQDFLRGSRVALAIGDRYLDRDALSKIQALMADHSMVLWAVLTDNAETKSAARELGLATRLPGSNFDLDGNAMVRAAERNETTDITGSAIAGANGSNTLLLQETIRSGRSVYHHGHVVIIGDVNPGAEIIAGGHVIVWGKLRGMVHAGAYGDATAFICALELIPTQLRISDQIAISPGDRRKKPLPEMVSIHDGQLIAEVWRTKK